MRAASELSKLITAAEDGDEEGLRDILSHARVNVNDVMPGGGTALHAAVMQGSVSVVSFLLEAGAVVDIFETVHGFTPLHGAAERGHLELVELLVAQLPSGPEGLKVLNSRTTAPNSRHCTALHLASLGGHEEVVERLLEAGADVSLLAVGSQTALHWAAWRSRRHVCSLLLRHGANPRLKDSHGKSAIDTAKDESIKQMLVLGTHTHSRLSHSEDSDQIIDPTAS